MDDDKGTDTTDAKEGCSGWFMLEAACSDDSDLDNSLEKLFEDGTESDVSDLINDDDTAAQGNSRELLCQQQSEECEQQIQYLKRKYFSPKAVQQLSPRLQSMNISPGHKSKRRLFVEHDSGLECSLNEAEDLTEEVEVPASAPAPAAQGGVGSGHYTSLLRCNNVKAVLLGKFKDAYGVSYNELTRPFRSNKTCCKHWVLAIYAAKDELIDASKQLLQQHCSYIWLQTFSPMSLYLCCFNVGKSRETVMRLMSSILQVHENHILSEPPKIRSMIAALFWYKGSMNPNVYAFGEYPDWIMTQTMIHHQTADSLQFDLSQMIQWAYDQDYVDECTIAYNYARLADRDSNARAFLAHNSQAKYVRECAQMVRYYKRGEMRDMSISAWIHHCISKIEGDGHWQDIVRFLRFQGLNFIVFLDKFRTFLQNFPKKNCLLIHGPPDTGKSMFSMSLMKALKGQVVSFANSKSHFWLQPLTDAKLALLDDATDVCWQYIDSFLRNGVDGNIVSIDMKHRAPCQMKFPPLIITSNISLKKEKKFPYLHSRIYEFEFPNKFPFDANDKPLFKLTDQSWASFFKRLWTQLELSDQEEEGENGETQRTFQCTAREVNGLI